MAALIPSLVALAGALTSLALATAARIKAQNAAAAVDEHMRNCHPDATSTRS